MFSVAIYSNFPFSNFAGTEKVTKILADWFLENNFQIRIVLFLNENEFAIPICDWLKEYKVERYLYPFRKLVRLRRFFRAKFGLAPDSLEPYLLEDWKKNGAPDFAVALSFPEILPNLKIAAKKSTKKIFVLNWDHTSLINYYYQIKKKDGGLPRLYSLLLPSILKRSLPSADLHMAISSDVKKIISEFHPQANIILVYNPVDIANARLIPRSKNPIFLFIGRIDDEHKNLFFLFKGLSLIEGENWTLKIFGRGKDENKLREVARTLSIEKNIQWHGYKDDPFGEISECTALLLTSRFEGFSLVLAEANAHGIPVISSNCIGGPKDIIIEGENGYLFPEGDLKSFVKLLKGACRGELPFGSPEQIRKTVTKYSLENYLEKIKNIFYEKLSSQN